MTDKTKLAAQRCADLATDVSIELGRGTKWYPRVFLESSGLSSDQLAFRRYVEAVSEAVERFREEWSYPNSDNLEKFDRLLGQFVLREPVDPLAETLREIFPDHFGYEKQFRDARAKRGLHITEIGSNKQ